MQKKILSPLVRVILLTLVINFAQAQYRVLRVVGSVRHVSGVLIRPCDQIQQNDPVIWSAATDRLFVFQRGKGDQILMPSHFKNSDEFVRELASMALHRELSSGDFSGRGVADSVPFNLQQDSWNHAPVIFRPINAYLFNPRTYPASEESFFLLNVVSRNNTVIARKKLLTKGDTLFINLTDFPPVLGADSTRYQIYYYNLEKRIPTDLLAEPVPVFDTKDEMSGIISATVQDGKQQRLDKGTVSNNALSNVYNVLGKPNAIAFSEIFERCWTAP
jgi:hypothetical protein